MHLPTDQANYATNSEVNATTNTRIVNDKPSDQGVKTADDQCHNTSRINFIGYSYRK